MNLLYTFLHHPYLLGNNCLLLLLLRYCGSTSRLKLISHVTSFRERKGKSEWFPSVPDGTKLKDNDIDTFVLSLLPLLKMAMFSKVGSIDAASTYHNLALIRPEMVLPDLLNW